jgi:uroporphyrinogen-III synthase
MTTGRIIVTGTKEDSAAFAARLEKEGFKAEALPTICIQKKKLDATLIAALRDLESYDYLIFSSPHAVTFFVEALRELWIKKPHTIKIAAVGPVTARALHASGFAPHIIPKKAGAIELVQELKGIDGKKVLFPRSARAGEEAIDALRERGAFVTPIILYTTTSIASEAGMFETATQDARCIIFMSPSGVAGFAKNFPGNILSEHVAMTRALAIGPTTAKAVSSAGFKHISIAKPSTLDGIIRILKSPS